MARVDFKKVLDDLYEGYPVKLTNEFNDEATITYDMHKAVRFSVKVEGVFGKYEPVIIDEGDLKFWISNFLSK